MEWLQNEASMIPELSMPCDKISPYFLNRKYQVEIATRDAWKERPLPFPPAEGIHCYTDGSRQGELSGCSAVVRGSQELSSEQHLALGAYATVFQAEVAGIHLAATFLLEERVSGESITIFSDSQACIKALASSKVRSHVIGHCAEILNALGTENQVCIEWIPGHSGLLGNERADALAKVASSQPVLEEPILPLSRAVCRMAVRKRMEFTHHRRWVNRGDCLHSKVWMPDLLTLARRVELMRLDRKDLWKLTAWFTGHSLLNHHLFRLRLSETAGCRRCGFEEETAEHVMAECPGYGLTRNLVFGEYSMDMDTLRAQKLSKLVKFIDSAKILEPRTG